MRRHTLIAGLLLASVACGDSTPRATNGDSTIVAAADTLADSAGSPATPPGFLAGACIAGEPEQGTAWTLSSAMAPSLVFGAIEALASRDSARLAVRLARTVDVLPSDTSIADFRGLPVAVRAAWLVVPAAGDTVVVALVVRRMPMESEPLEEVFTIIAAPGERPGVRDPLIEAWVVRDVGREETLSTRELVGAYASAEGPALVLMRDDGSGRRAELMTRRGGRWAATWSGALPACAP